MVMDYDSEEYGNPGGEYHSRSREELEDMLGRMATRGNDWGGDFGGEFAKLLRPFLPPDYLGGVAVQPSDADPVLELV
jgi:hypothetical protein